MSSRDQLRSLRVALDALEACELPRIERMGRSLTRRLVRGARLLIAGNGASAAQAHGMTAVVVSGSRCGRRPPLSAIALHADGAAMTAVASDHGPLEGLGRQLRAHARPRDVLLAMSASGSCPNIVAAAHAAREIDLAVWGLTGPAPNPVSRLCDEVIAVPSGRPSTVLEVHQLVIHMLCEAIEREFVGDAGGLTVVA